MRSSHEPYPQFIDRFSVLHTGLNIGAIFQPYAAERGLDQCTVVSSVLHRWRHSFGGAGARGLDRERVTVAAAIGIRARTAQEWLKMAYDASGENLYAAIQNQPGYRGIKAPSTLNHRYVFEDVPMSLVPIAAFGQRYGVSVQEIDAIIRLACTVHQTDYWRRGRTLNKLGIEQLSVAELTRYAMEGVAARTVLSAYASDAVIVAGCNLWRTVSTGAEYARFRAESGRAGGGHTHRPHLPDLSRAAVSRYGRRAAAAGRCVAVTFDAPARTLRHSGRGHPPAGDRAIAHGDAPTWGQSMPVQACPVPQA